MDASLTLKIAHRLICDKNLNRPSVNERFKSLHSLKKDMRSKAYQASQKERNMKKKATLLYLKKKTLLSTDAVFADVCISKHIFSTLMIKHFWPSNTWQAWMSHFHLHWTKTFADHAENQISKVWIHVFALPIHICHNKNLSLTPLEEILVSLGMLLHKYVN